MARTAHGSTWGSFVSGLASVAALPIAIYLSRFSERYELLHAGFAIPIAAVLGVISIALSRRARVRTVLALGRGERAGLARAGRVLGIVGVCMALAALVSLGVYGLLEYVGGRD
ncbi:MAG: hypothetical protein ACR2M2_00690 [Gaiellaceae bacterium]